MKVKLPGAVASLVLLAWVGTRPVRAEEYHDNVVIVLDASGSMNETLAGTRITKITAAKSALKTVLQQVPASTHIGLLVFSAKNLTDDWVYPLGPRRDEELLRAIERPLPRNDTPLGRYLKKGADRLLEERAKQFGYGTYRLLVVTDGEAQDRVLVDRYTPEIVARGITVDVIGVGMSQDHTLATKVHSYRRANDPAALNRAVAEVLAEVAKPRTDTAQADAFELLAPLPIEVAAAALQALSVSSNQPIGQHSPSPTPAPSPSVDQRPAAAPAPASTPPPSPPPSAAGGRRTKSHILILMVLGFIIFGLLGRAARGRRR
jgi:hypothetical protein